MLSLFGIPKALIALLLCIPGAILIGFLLATPGETSSVFLVGSALLVISIPFLLRWHHAVLIVSWNAYVTAFFLPGQPHIWMVVTVVSLVISILSRTVNKEQRWLHAPSVAIPLVLLGLWVLITAYLTGGIGIRLLGSATFGGKRYFYMIGCIIGYFALTARAVEPSSRTLLTVLFCVSGVTAAFSNLAYALGPSFYFLFYLFPPEWARLQAFAEFTPTGLVRFGGLLPASIAVLSALLAYFGVSGLLKPRKAWRFGLVVLVFAAALLSGFRSAVILLILVFSVQFYCEGLLKTRLFPILITVCLVTGVFAIPFADKLPRAAQRALSFLPGLDIDPIARHDAQESLNWRFDMWSVVAKDIPKYAILGKGFSINSSDMFLTDEGIRRGFYRHFESAIINGDYHSGPLSLLITFGFIGGGLFIWFAVAALRVLYSNFRYSEPSMNVINTFMFSYFVARLVFFTFFYGAFWSDLYVFVGIVAFSISLNGGVRKAPVLERETREAEELVPVPA